MPTNPTPAERVALARRPDRPNIRDWAQALFDDVFELHGDRNFSDDRAMYCAVATFDNRPVTVAGHVKAKDLEGNLECNFGMPGPEGYRKFQRAAQGAEKFGRPVITFIDTPGAYPGIGAEERGQGEAIARCLLTLSALRAPIIAVITGEGGSGGALALAVADRIIMLENSIFSVLSPEGFAAILWKDASRAAEAADVMKLTAEDLLAYGVADRIIREPEGGISQKPLPVIYAVGAAIREELASLTQLSADELIARRYEKYRKIGGGSEN